MRRLKLNLNHQRLIVGLVLLQSVTVTGQYFDPDHIQDLRFRLLISYFQEYRTFDMSIAPAQTTAPESLPTRLSSPVVGLSGFLLQYNNASVYLAGSFTEKDNPIADPDAKATSSLPPISMWHSKIQKTTCSEKRSRTIFPGNRNRYMARQRSFSGSDQQSRHWNLPPWISEWRLFVI